MNDLNPQFYFARIAGFSYVLFTVAGLIKNFLLNTKVAEISEIQLYGVFENDVHFRLGILAETVMFIAVVTASVSFYLVFKTVHKPLAQTALCLRMVEIIVGGIAVVASMIMLALSMKTHLFGLLGTEQMKTMIVFAANMRVPAYEYSWIFMGLAGVITFYLFFKTRYIPIAWSVWGMITYTSLIIYPLAKLLIPDLPREAMFVLMPGALFELGVGIWLMAFGIRPAPDDNSAIV